MILEGLLEQKIVEQLSSIDSLSSTQFIASRSADKTEDGDSVVAVAASFRQHDSFSLSPVTLPVTFTIVTRVEEDAEQQKHNTIVEAITDKLSYWHKYGAVMQEALTTEKCVANELKMDGGSESTFDDTEHIWTDTINISIRGAEKFIPPTPPTPPEPPTPQLSNCYAVYADGRTSEWHVAGETFNSFNIDKNGLVNLRIQDGIQYIGVQALMNASQLSSVELPSTLIELKQNAFDTCNLLSVSIPEGTYALRKQCLQDNRDMKTVVIPSTVDTIESDAFYLCKNVDDVYCYPNPNYLEWDDDGDDDFKPNGQTICHVKSQWLQKYQNDFSSVNVTFVGDL